METITRTSVMSMTMVVPSSLQQVVNGASTVTLSASFASPANTSVALASPLQVEELP